MVRIYLFAPGQHARFVQQHRRPTISKALLKSPWVFPGLSVPGSPTMRSGGSFVALLVA